MRHTPYLVLILSVLVVFPGISHSQDRPGNQTDQPKTGDTLAGIYYYLKMVPGDTSKPDRMPTVPGDEDVFVGTQPIPLKSVPPVYPEKALEERTEGTVWLKCLIDRTGRVVDTRVMRSDSDILNQAAIDAARQWIFKPAFSRGHPVQAWAAIPFRFKLTH